MRHIADFAADHFKQHHRPLRVAVDEACWRFTNLTPEQVEKIRQGEPAANPVEKVILWRLLRLLKLNVQLLFVWDGLRKPGKGRNQGRGGGKVDQKCVELLHQMFDLLKVPYHRAPGEAEAECARLQKLGIVDVVWADDCDSFMFGCSTLIKQHKVNGNRITDHIRVYQSSEIQQRLDLDADSFVLFALLSGGDYYQGGLRDCGPSKAKLLARRRHGLARALTHVSQEDLPAWRDSLAETMKELRISVEIPYTYPPWKALEGYRNPAVSTEEQCRNLRGLRGGWDQRIEQIKLRNELRHRYNFTTREYLKHITPILLARLLARDVSPARKEENSQLGIQLKPTRRRKPAEGIEVPAKSEVKIMYSAHLLAEVDLSETPEGEDWPNFSAKDGTPYDPMQKIEGEILECFLQHGLPKGALNVVISPKKRQRKSTDRMENASTPVNQAAIVHPSSAAGTTTADASIEGTGKEVEPVAHSSKPKAQTASKKRGRPPKDNSDTPKSTKKKRKAKDAIEQPQSPPPAKFIRRQFLDVPRSPEARTASGYRTSAKVIDLCGDEESEEDTNAGTMGPFVSPGTMPRPTLMWRSSDAVPATRPIELDVPFPTRLPNIIPPSQAQPISSSTSFPSSQRSEVMDTYPSRWLPIAQSRSMSTPRLTAKDLTNRKTREDDQGSNQKASSCSVLDGVTSTMHLPSSELVPGETIAPATLRELRLAAVQGKSIASNRSTTKAKSSPVSERLPIVHEVIDLT